MADLRPEDRAWLEGLLRNPPSRARLIAEVIGDFSNVALYSAMQRAKRDPDYSEALRILARGMLDAGEAVPGALRSYGLRAWVDAPRPKRGRPRQAERDMWAVAVFDALRGEGWKVLEAQRFIADNLHVTIKAVESILRGAPANRPRLRLKP